MLRLRMLHFLIECLVLVDMHQPNVRSILEGIAVQEGLVVLFIIASCNSYTMPWNERSA
jgi:hypothetical protein